MTQGIQNAFENVVYVAHAAVRGVQVDGNGQTGIAKALVTCEHEFHPRGTPERFGSVCEVTHFPACAPIVVDAWRVWEVDLKNHRKSLRNRFLCVVIHLPQQSGDTKKEYQV